MSQQLSLQNIYTSLDHQLEPAERDELFWRLAGERAYKTWQWFKSNNPDSTFEQFWYGESPTAPAWEPEKYFLKALQDNLREKDMLPRLLSLVRDPFWLEVALGVYKHLGWVYLRAHLNLFWYISSKNLSSTTRQALADWAYQQRAVPAALLKQAMQVGILDTNGQFINAHLERFFRSYGMALELHTAIQQNVPPAEYWTDEQWWEPNAWDEAALLLPLILEDANPIVRWLAPVQPTLAYRCATESGMPYDLEILNPLYTPAANARVTPLARVKWLTRIAEQDNRPGVGLLEEGVPDIKWCKIPAGNFQMGGDPQAINPAAEQMIDLPYAYQVSQYLITYRQYTAFIEAGGYQNPAYWTQTGWAWKQDRHQPDYWHDPQFHHANCPVLGVTWYEALAFARWLNAVVPHPIDTIIRLLTESEWEKAARYPDGRFYPWGNSYIPGMANLNETSDNQEYIDYTVPNKLYYLRRTSPVGVYPPNPAGIYDLSGNLWEWCLSTWEPSYQYPENNQPEGDLHRVVHGGSWNYTPDHARAATRLGFSPELRGGVGIRVGCVPV